LSGRVKTMSKRRDVSAELVPVAEHYALNELWDTFLKPRLPELSEPLLLQAIKNLESQHMTLCAWQQGSRTGDHITWHRSAVEPHEQDQYPEPVDVVIDVARDSLEWLVQNQPDSAANWCKRLINSNVPMSRRLGVHVLSERTDLTADGKSQFLLENADIHDVPAHHETFRLFKLIYPDLAEPSRRAIITAILAFLWPDDEEGRREERTAYEHFRWLSWLQQADPECQIVQVELKRISANYPDFTPSEHPDLTHWISTGWVEPQSPWSAEQLLAKPAEVWLPELLEFKGEDFWTSNNRGLVTAVVTAAKKNVEWGVNLSKALIDGEFWESNLWPGLIQGWSEMELDESTQREVLDLITKAELYRAHPRDIAQSFYVMVKGEEKPAIKQLLPNVNKAAEDLWKSLDREDVEAETGDWLQKAINHPGGILAEYWLHSLALWRKAQDPKPDNFDDEYLRIFIEIANDQSFAGKLGRSVLASQLAFLLNADKKWAQTYLVPLFDFEERPTEFQAAWDGFLSWGRLNKDVFEVLNRSFLNATTRLEAELSARLNRFVEYYTAIVLFDVEDPMQEWIPELFRHGGIDARTQFASNVGRHLRKLNPAQQQELWDRWLKRYWEGRLQNVPVPLEAEEIKYMLGWLTKLPALFSEATALAVQMPQMPLERFQLVYDLRKSQLIEEHPETVLSLLAYLANSGSPNYIWHGLSEVLDRLRSMDLAEHLSLELEEISTRVGIFD